MFAPLHVSDKTGLTAYALKWTLQQFLSRSAWRFLSLYVILSFPAVNTGDYSKCLIVGNLQYWLGIMELCTFRILGLVLEGLLFKRGDVQETIAKFVIENKEAWG